jgi:DNA-binding NarL/FixJ family response regulator
MIDIREPSADNSEKRAEIPAVNATAVRGAMRMTLNGLISHEELQIARSKSPRVLIVDDEAINRLGLRYLLASLTGVEVVAEATNGAEAVEMATRLSPDLILMDLTMPEMDGIATTRAIRKSKPETKILILTSVAGPGQVSQAIAAGAHGYCMKDSNPEEFLTALNVVLNGNVFLDAKVLPALIESLSNNERNNKTSFQKTDAYAPLSDFELEILSMKMRGATVREIAQSLNLSLDSVSKMELRIKEKIFDLGSSPTRSQGKKKSSSHVRICEQCLSVYSLESDFCPIDGTALADEETGKWIGTTLDGKYELLSFLGKGGGASVFKGHHRFLNQNVAIKIIHGEHSTDFTMLQRFRREAEISSRLNHPNIVQVYDFGIVDSGTPYLVMEFLEGISLAAHLKSFGKMTCSEILSVFWQICCALECAHQSGLIHRDVKPGNIFMSNDPTGESLVKLLDFGLAKSIQRKNREDALTMHGHVVGNPEYMSPESCRGLEYSKASDIYALGCTAFECLNGAPPFRGDTITEIMYRQINDSTPRLFAPVPITPLEVSLTQIIEKCLEKDPTLRYASVTEIKSDLLELQYLI